MESDEPVFDFLSPAEPERIFFESDKIEIGPVEARVGPVLMSCSSPTIREMSPFLFGL